MGQEVWRLLQVQSACEITDYFTRYMAVRDGMVCIQLHKERHAFQRRKKQHQRRREGNHDLFPNKPNKTKINPLTVAKHRQSFLLNGWRWRYPISSIVLNNVWLFSKPSLCPIFFNEEPPQVFSFWPVCSKEWQKVWFYCQFLAIN